MKEIAISLLAGMTVSCLFFINIALHRIAKALEERNKQTFKDQ